jgi:hypothetical protein
MEPNSPSLIHTIILTRLSINLACKNFAPVMDQLADLSGDTVTVAKVDVDGFFSLAQLLYSQVASN